MPVYAYDGLNAEGRAVSGIVDAENARAARMKLRRTGVYPTALTEAETSKKEDRLSLNTRVTFERVTPQDVSVMTRQLSTLTSAGLPLVESI
jgi:general secretion pathway protein F